MAISEKRKSEISVQGNIQYVIQYIMECTGRRTQWKYFWVRYSFPIDFIEEQEERKHDGMVLLGKLLSATVMNYDLIVQCLGPIVTIGK